MNEIKDDLLEASIGAFARFGVKKTSMSDIAEAAQISRPTLYASYGNKDEVLAASIRYMSARSLERVKSAWEDTDDLDQKLDIYFSNTIIPAFELIQSSPDADDLVSGYNAAGKEAILESRSNARNAFVEILIAHEKPIAASGQSVEQFAHFIVVAAHSMKYAANSHDELLALLASLKASVLAIANEPISN